MPNILNKINNKIMNITNSWKSKVKQKDKIEITLRISMITILEINIDFSKKSYNFMLLNFGVKF
jgi:hypothetical protein